MVDQSNSSASFDCRSTITSVWIWNVGTRYLWIGSISSIIKLNETLGLLHDGFTLVARACISVMMHAVSASGITSMYVICRPVVVVYAYGIMDVNGGKKLLSDHALLGSCLPCSSQPAPEYLPDFTMSLPTSFLLCVPDLNTVSTALIFWPLLSMTIS